MFWKKEKICEDLIDFSMRHISTGMINAYILKILYEKEGFSKIGYRYEYTRIGQRFILYTYSGCNPHLKQFFKDRCPGMIEEAIRSMDEQMPCSWEKWANGFEFVVPYKEK